MQDGLQSAVRAFLNQPVWWQQTGSRSRETGSSEVGGQNWVLGLTVPLDAQEAPLHLKVYYNQAETEESGRGGRNQKRFHMAVLLDLTALGPLRADLIQDAGLLSVRIQVRRPQTLTWMQEEVEALRFALEEGQDLPVRLLLEADRGHIARFFTEDVLEDREEGESVGTGPGQIDVKV